MRPGLFLHIQKTAGTSILATADELYGRQQCAMWDDYIRHSPAKLNDLSFISGHFGFDFAQYFMQGRYCFTFLRDPVERLISFYSYCRGANKDDNELNMLAHNSSAEQFFHSGSTADAPFASHMWNHQACQLASGWGASLVGKRDVGLSEWTAEQILAQATHNLGAFDYVGLVEDFATDSAAIFEALGGRLKHTRRVNVAPDRIKREDLDHSTLAMLDQMTEIDRELYRWAIARRETLRESALKNRRQVGGRWPQWLQPFKRVLRSRVR